MHDSNDVDLDFTKPILQFERDSFEERNLALALKAMEMFSGVKSNTQIFRRNVMAFLKEKGYNTVICKTKWESPADVPSETTNSLTLFYRTLKDISSIWTSLPNSLSQGLVIYTSIFCSTCREFTLVKVNI
ncbi:uncharacterized protein Fot_04315 [Forsythia ovata]|uniref:Uncharacterized protein n=1 Tax=Forsythia ovata TaxID=205694 RepID=A0ABD1XC80_9LAMI